MKTQGDCRHSVRNVVCGVLTMLVLLEGALAQSLSLDRERMKTILDIVARDIEKNFYDPGLKGLDWRSLTDQTRQRIEKAQTTGEMVTAIFALTDKLQDSHTIFLPPPHAHRAEFGFEAKAFGNEVRAYEVKKDGAAKAAGLQDGDHILSINRVAVDRENIDLAMLLFRALRPVGAMDIEVARGNEAPHTIHVEAKIKQGSYMMDMTNMNTIWQLVRESERERKNPEYKRYDDDIGYLKIPNFESAPEQIHPWGPKAKDDKAVIIDLRDNPGGRTDTLATFAGFFQNDETEMGQVITRKKSEPLKIKAQHPGVDAPMFILVDSRSASAAEMFARHFQVNHRAMVVGDQTSGRVNAARLFVERTGAEIVVPFATEITVGRVVFPGGEELEKRGVTPDFVCIPTGEDLRQEKDPCLDAALKLARVKLGISKTAAADSSADKTSVEKK